MRSAFAQAIAEFLDGGGEITRCPDGNALLGPEHRSKVAVGNAKFFSLRHAANCATALEALKHARAALTLSAIIARSGMSKSEARTAVARLVRQGKIVRAPGIGQARLYIAMNSGSGQMAGGPASASAAGAATGLSSSPAARPGSAE